MRIRVAVIGCIKTREEHPGKFILQVGVSGNVGRGLRHNIWFID